MSDLSVLFVCLGNICRSPTAEAVFRQRLVQAGLAKRVAVDSCGTGDWHVGSSPDNRTIRAAAVRGYDLSTLRARQLRNDDLSDFDFVLAMDRNNLQVIRSLPSAATSCAKVGLFLDFAEAASECEVPDPYYGGEQGFDHVLDLVEQASEGLLAEVRRRLESQS